ncbi:putative phosphatase regulatory subunit-domain-containing protein, partial [Phycomyces blakesleeanus]
MAISPPLTLTLTLTKQDNKKPTIKKSVRFRDSDLETVRLFLKTEMPSAVHKDSLPPSPVPGAPRYELKYMNWPSKTIQNQTTKSNTNPGLSPLNNNNIRLENIQLSNSHDKPFGLVGFCRVANLAFQKHVVVRYSLDTWNTYSELEASYREPIVSTANTWERFSFSIPLDKPKQVQTIYIALCYTVNSTEYWDNNTGNNYSLNL